MASTLFEDLQDLHRLSLVLNEARRKGVKQPGLPHRKGAPEVYGATPKYKQSDKPRRQQLFVPHSEYPEAAVSPGGVESDPQAHQRHHAGTAVQKAVSAEHRRRQGAQPGKRRELPRPKAKRTGKKVVNPGLSAWGLGDSLYVPRTLLVTEAVLFEGRKAKKQARKMRQRQAAAAKRERKKMTTGERAGQRFGNVQRRANVGQASTTKLARMRERGVGVQRKVGVGTGRKTTEPTKSKCSNSPFSNETTFCGGPGALKATPGKRWSQPANQYLDPENRTYPVFTGKENRASMAGTLRQAYVRGISTAAAKVSSAAGGTTGGGRMTGWGDGGRYHTFPRGHSQYGKPNTKRPDPDPHGKGGREVRYATGAGVRPEKLKTKGKEKREKASVRATTQRAMQQRAATAVGRG